MSKRVDYKENNALENWKQRSSTSGHSVYKKYLILKSLMYVFQVVVSLTTVVFDYDILQVFIEMWAGIWAGYRFLFFIFSPVAVLLSTRTSNRTV